MTWFLGQQGLAKDRPKLLETQLPCVTTARRIWYPGRLNGGTGTVLTEGPMPTVVFLCSALIYVRYFSM